MSAFDLDESTYRLVCRHLGLPEEPGRRWEAVRRYLAEEAPRRAPRPRGFSLALAGCRPGPSGLAALDVWTRLLDPSNPWRWRFNAVLAVHECDAEGWASLAGQAPAGRAAAWFAAFRAVAGGALAAALGAPWIAGRWAQYRWRRARQPDEFLRAACEGRIALVTGASRGLGEALARALAAAGARVVAVARDRAALEALARDVPGLVAAPADVSVDGALEAALAAAGVAPGSVDLAIANAGRKTVAADALDPAAIRADVETNLFGAVRTIRAVLPGMFERKGGQIVVVSSLGRWHGMADTPGYNASKAALSNLVDSLRIELAARGASGIDAVLVEPGFVRTSMVPETGLAAALAEPAGAVACRILLAVADGRLHVTTGRAMPWIARALAALPAGWRARVLARTRPRT